MTRFSWPGLLIGGVLAFALAVLIVNVMPVTWDGYGKPKRYHYYVYDPSDLPPPGMTPWMHRAAFNWSWIAVGTTVGAVAGAVAGSRFVR